jgi:hypothetical protein
MKRILKRLAMLIGGGLLIVAALTFTITTSKRYAHFKEEMSGLGGVKLDDQQQEVLYAQGRPTFLQKSADDPLVSAGFDLPSGAKIEDYPVWQWLSDKASLTVEFDQKGRRVKSISCFTFDPNLIYGPCTAIGNITTGRDQDSSSGHYHGSEGYIVATLGEPSDVLYDRVGDLDRKTLIYEGLGLIFTMAGRQLLSIHMQRTDHDFFRWFLYGPSI